jgi:hypothetical protein
MELLRLGSCSEYDSDCGGVGPEGLGAGIARTPSLRMISMASLGDVEFEWRNLVLTRLDGEGEGAEVAPV